MHLKKHRMSSKDYYDKYIKQDGEGLCKRCGKPTKYGDFKYRVFCSRKCSNITTAKDIDKIKKASIAGKKPWSNPETRERMLKFIKSTERREYLSKKFKGRENTWNSKMNQERKGILRVPYEIRTCECGCGEIFASKINSKKRFIVKHYAKLCIGKSYAELYGKEKACNVRNKQ